MNKLEQLHFDNHDYRDAAEITEQIAIEFQEFIRYFCIVDWDVNDMQVYVYQGNFFYTAKDLFQEFLKTKQ